MRTPNLFIAYAPRGAGLRCAIAYLSGERDAYGWFTGPRHDTTIASQYFLIDGLYRPAPAEYHAVDAQDLHADWALAEPRRHELARLQETFAREWLFYRDAPAALRELEAYAEAELATGDVGLRFARLEKLHKSQPNWTYYSPRFEGTVLRTLERHWPLELHLEEPERKRRAAGARP